MAATTIHQLFNEYTSAPDDQPEYVLDFFMRNAIPFNNVNAFQNSDELHHKHECTASGFVRCPSG